MERFVEKQMVMEYAEKNNLSRTIDAVKKYIHEAFGKSAEMTFALQTDPDSGENCLVLYVNRNEYSREDSKKIESIYDKILFDRELFIISTIYSQLEQAS
jgi:hypothetical protein